MKKLLPLILLLVVGAVGALYLLQDEQGRGPAVGETPVDRATAEPSTPEELAAAARPEATGLAPAASPAEQRATESTRTEAGEGPTQRRAGRVVLPPGAPADDSLQVLALANSENGYALYGPGGIVPRLHHAGQEVPTEVLSRASVGEDGSYEIELPDERSWLVVDGRYLRSQRPVEVPAGDEVPTLTPRLSAFLSGQVRLPETALASAEPAALFDGIKLELGPDSSQFSMVGTDLKTLFSRGSFLDAQGHYAFRAVDSDLPCELAVRSDDFADQRKDGLDLSPGRELVLDVQLTSGGRLQGRVVAEGGAPVADARVRVRNVVMWGMDGGSLAETRTDEAGLFDLKGVPPGKARVMAEASGWLESPPQSLEVADGQVIAGLELELPVGAHLAGRVTWPDGRPAAGIEVEVDFDPQAMMTGAAMNMGRGADGDAETDDDGRFEVRGLGKGPFMVHTEARVGAKDERATRLADWDDSADDEADPEVWYAERTGVAPDTEGIELVLVPPMRLAGVVQDAEGNPVPEFHLRADSKGAVFFLPGESKGQNYEDEQGRFTLLGLRGGVWELSATAEGFGPSVPVEVTLAPGVTNEPVLITLVPAAEIRGVVLSPRGEPVPGARVTIRPPNQKLFAQMAGRMDLPEVHAGEQGEFTLGGLSIGDQGLVATHADYASSEVVPVELTAGAVESGVVLTLRSGAILTGEVYGPDGEAASGTQVIVQDSSTFEVIMRRTDADGAFRVENLRPGGWNVTAMVGAVEAAADTAEDSENLQASMMKNMRFTQVEVKDGEAKHVVLGAPPEDPVLVRGTVRHAGRGTGGGMVSFFSEGASGMDKLRMATLSADGSYEVQLDSPGRYLVSVQLQPQQGGFQQNNVEFSETVPDSEEHRLDLELPVGRISGRIVGPDKKALSGARVTLTIDGGVKTGTFMGGQYGEATTNESGEYSFDYLREGDYAVAAGGALFGGVFGTDSKEGRMVRGGLHVKAGASLDGVDFRLEEPGDLQGRVVDATGAPVANAALFVRDANGLLLERFSMIASGQDGRFRYSGLAPGEYLVSARSSEQASPESTWVKVRSKETAEVTVTVQPGSMLIVVLVDDSGREGEFPGATLSVTDPEGREVNGMLAYAEIMRQLESGVSSIEQRLGPLAPGRYKITATTPDGLTATKPVNLDGQSERRIRLRLR